MEEFLIIGFVVLFTLTMMWLQVKKLHKHHPNATLLISLLNLISKKNG
jgi:hypothetical protein